MLPPHQRLDNIGLSFEGFARTSDGKIIPFALRVGSPIYDDERGFFCYVKCPVLREKPLMIFGVDERQACELSISFIRQVMSDRRTAVVGANGEEISIPEIGCSGLPTSE